MILTKPIIKYQPLSLSASNKTTVKEKKGCSISVSVLAFWGGSRLEFLHSLLGADFVI
jgi:hypothetical protein